MSSRLMADLVVFILVAICVAVVYAFWTQAEREEQVVPITTELEQAITVDYPDLAIQISEASREEFNNKKNSGEIQGSILRAKDPQMFLKDVLSFTKEKKVIHKTFLKGYWGEHLKRLDSHIYWTEALDGRLLLGYEVEYTPPPTTLPHGGRGSFKELSEDGVVFGYVDLTRLWLGCGVASVLFLIGLMLVFVAFGKVRKRRREQQEEEAANAQQSLNH